MNPPDRVVATLRPNLVAPGLYDTGQGVSGWARLRLRAPSRPQAELKFIEEQGSDYGQSDSYVAPAVAPRRSGSPASPGTPSAKSQVTGAVDPLDLQVRVAHTQVARTGSFACSNDLFNRIHETYIRTQLANMHGGVTSDCPHRERLGYTGDGQVAAQSAIYALDMARFYTKWTQDIHDARNHKTGFVPHTAPFEGGGGGPPWGSGHGPDALVSVPVLRRPPRARNPLGSDDRLGAVPGHPPPTPPASSLRRSPAAGSWATGSRPRRSTCRPNWSARPSTPIAPTWSRASLGC